MLKKITVPLAVLLLLCSGGYALVYRFVLADLAAKTYNMFWMWPYFYFAKPMLCLSGSFLAVWCLQGRLFKGQTRAVQRIFCIIGLITPAAYLIALFLILATELHPPIWAMMAIFSPPLWLFTGALLALGIGRPVADDGPLPPMP